MEKVEESESQFNVDPGNKKRKIRIFKIKNIFIFLCGMLLLLLCITYVGITQQYGNQNTLAADDELVSNEEAFRVILGGGVYRGVAGYSVEPSLLGFELDREVSYEKKEGTLYTVNFIYPNKINQLIDMDISYCLPNTDICNTALSTELPMDELGYFSPEMVVINPDLKKIEYKIDGKIVETIDRPSISPEIITLDVIEIGEGHSVVWEIDLGNAEYVSRVLEYQKSSDDWEMVVFGDVNEGNSYIVDTEWLNTSLSELNFRLLVTDGFNLDTVTKNNLVPLPEKEIKIYLPYGKTYEFYAAGQIAFIDVDFTDPETGQFCGGMGCLTGPNKDMYELEWTSDRQVICEKDMNFNGLEYKTLKSGVHNLHLSILHKEKETLHGSVDVVLNVKPLDEIVDFGLINDCQMGISEGKSTYDAIQIIEELDCGYVKSVDTVYYTLPVTDTYSYEFNVADKKRGYKIITSLEGVNPAGFIVVSNSNNRCYAGNEDITFFTTFTEDISILDGANVSSLRFKYDSKFAFGENSTYYLGLKIPEYDYETFELVWPDTPQSTYVTDKNGVYFVDFSKTDIEFVFLPNLNVDLAKFFPFRHDRGYVTDLYAYNSNYAYYRDVEVASTNMNNFQVLSDSYARDDIHLYYHDTVMQNVDMETFELIRYILVKDKNNIYCKSSIIEGADLDTFTALSWQEKLEYSFPAPAYKDKDNLYLSNCQIRK